jgi:hypothetical protein
MHFDFSNGGIVVQFYLAKLLDELGLNVRIIISDFNTHYNTYKNNSNNIFNRFWTNDFPIDDNVIVIYCEGTTGNPLGAKNVVRWMLSELGKNVPVNRLHTWGKNELVYYFNKELIHYKTPEKIYKYLPIIYLDPIIKNINNKRKGCCYTIRKGSSYHKNLNYIHPNGSFEITRQHSQYDYVKIFNKFDIFITYDNLTFLTIISVICGCITIVNKVDGLSKSDWIKTLGTFSDYMENKGINELYGIAYGIDDLEYARKTIHLAETQLKDIINYGNNSINSFISDIQNFKNMTNTINNNFYI